MLLCCRVKDGPRLAPYAAYHTLLLGTYVQERSLSNLPGIRVGSNLYGALFAAKLFLAVCLFLAVQRITKN